MSVNNRQKKRIDGYLFKMSLHSPEEAAEIQMLLEHYEGVISDWQQATGKLHPTLTGVFEAETKQGEDF